MHGIATGDESRQLLYTMLTRGRHENHLHVVVAGDGDPHQLVLPETTSPATATEILEGILARDGAAVSAASTARNAVAPEHQLHQAATRYADAVVAGAEHLTGPQWSQQLESHAEGLLPGITDCPAWPALRAHLLLVETDGHHAQDALSLAVATRSLDDADDPAAVLTWRLAIDFPEEGGPLPWLPPIPRGLVADPEWSPYLTARAGRVETLSAQVRAQVDPEHFPDWARPIQTHLSSELLGDLVEWRAANGIEASDRRPAGPPLASGNMANAHQQSLIRRINDNAQPALAEWGAHIDRHVRYRDNFTPELAQRLAALQRRGHDADRLLTDAAQQGPLPDDHSSSALWYRILDDIGDAQPPRRTDTAAADRLRTAPHQQPPRPPSPSPGIGR